MPIMSNLEQNQILEHANFLFMMGYKLINQDAHGFVFANNKFQFIIFYERRQDASDITIRFMKENETFSIGWLSFIDDKNKSMKFVVVKPYVNFKNIDDVTIVEPRNIG